MKIIKTPNKILTKKAKPISKFDKKLARLVRDMVETLKEARNPEGVGLAAPQVNVSKRLFVMQVNPNSSKSKPKYEVFINPKIIEVGSGKWEVGKRREKCDNLKKGNKSRNSKIQKISPKAQKHHTSHFTHQNILEGCLSIDNIWGYPSRSSWVKLAYNDLSGKKHTKAFSGFPAVIIQHEVDHLNGILFTQRILEQKGELYKIKKDEDTKKPVLVPLGL